MRTRILALLLAVPLIARADPSPFGFTIGTATLTEVRKGLAGRTRLEDHGPSTWTGGPMLYADGAGLGIEGLERAIFVFDLHERLVGVAMDLPQARYDAIRSYLAGKYEWVEEKAPRVGDRSVKFRNGPVSITAHAPHLSFGMDVIYVHDDLDAAYRMRSLEDERRQDAVEREKF